MIVHYMPTSDSVRPLCGRSGRLTASRAASQVTCKACLRQMGGRNKARRNGKKYDYLYVLQGHYAHGWEDLAAEAKKGAGTDLVALRAIRQTKKEYQQNEGGAYRIVQRREPRGEGTARANRGKVRRNTRGGIPGISAWNTYGGGFGPQDKRSYDFYAQSSTGRSGPGGKVQYSVSPIATARGLHRGYQLSVFPGQHLGHGHTGIAPDGSEVGLHAATLYRSPQAAVAAARKHATTYGVK